MKTFYGPVLSAIHDEYYGDLACAAGSYLSGLRPPGWLVGKQAVDLGCGSGILAGTLAAAGARVTGIDIAEDMLALARQRVPGGSFYQGSIYTYELPEADVYCATGEPFNYYSGDPPGAADLRDLLARIRDRISASGILLFDLLTDSMPAGSTRRKISFPGRRMQLHITVDPGNQRLSRDIQIKDPDGTLILRETHFQALFRAGEIESNLTAVGFRWQRLAGYGTHTFRGGHVGYCCTRR